MNRLKKNTELEDIRNIAAEWVARVYSGNASEGDEVALNAWLDKDEQHRREYMRALEVWDTSGLYGFEQSLEPSSSLKFHWFYQMDAKAISKIAAVFLLMFVSVYYTYVSQAPKTQVASYATKTGETQKLLLADGSTVTLNTGSKLYVDFSENIRRAILDSGEAFFDVSKDPERPFVVTAGEQSVTVLGTRFNVHRDGKKLTVAVVEGVVAVHENIEPEKLEENARSLFENASIDAEGDFTHYRLEAGSVGTFEKTVDLKGNVEEVADAQSHQDWRQGIVRFSESPLVEVVDELSRYSIVPIEIADEALADLKISGVFHHDDLIGALAGLEAVLPIEVEHRANRIILYSNVE